MRSHADACARSVARACAVLTLCAIGAMEAASPLAAPAAMAAITTPLRAATSVAAPESDGQASASARTAAAAPPRAALSVAAVEAAASAVRADDDLGGLRKQRTWRFRDRNAPSEPPTPAPQWLRELARWLAESGRWLIWLLIAAAAVALLVTARRWLLVQGAAIGARGAPLPSHVRELDIRPESLPADIGAAVRALWLAGERRAALSLLYRGALSRLVHSYAVPIGDASTEGDCVQLARAALPAPRSEFVSALVQAWQLAVYGDRPLASEHVLRLCADFDRLLPTAPPMATAEAKRR